MPEEETFCVLVSLMNNYQLRKLFLPDMADLSCCFYQLEKLIEVCWKGIVLHEGEVGGGGWGRETVCVDGGGRQMNNPE